MGTNSIKTNLSKEDIISDIQLSLGADFEREYTYLVVEGEDDWKFLRGMMDEKVIIYESFSGKGGVMEIIDEHFHDNPRVIGIRDKDYEQGEISKNIFMYDYCCMEMMFIKKDDVFESICNEYCLGEFQANEIREELLSQLKAISLIRKYNERSEWGLKLEGLSIDNAYDKEQKLISFDKVIEQINKMNNDFFTQDLHKLVQIKEEEKTIMKLDELLNITQGHDFTNLLAVYCKKSKGKAYSGKDIEKSLRCTYRKNDFEETELYRCLDDYQQQYKLKIV